MVERSRIGLFHTAREWERLRLVICTGCSAVLPPATPTDTLLEKLAQLARFGLAEGGTPILELMGPRHHPDACRES